MTYKSLGFAYPSSALAEQLGHKSEGCWFVSLVNGVGDEDGNLPEPNYTFASVDLAPAYEYWQLMLEQVSTWCQTRSSTWPIVLRRETGRTWNAERDTHPATYQAIG